MAKLEIVNGKFFFNLTADVGRNSPNRLDDVELVRYGYFCITVNPAAMVLTSPEMKAALTKLKSLGPFGPDLQTVIDVHQKDRGGTIDGKISVGKPELTHNLRYDDKHSWIIFVLCNNMNAHVPESYPRIDFEIESGNEISKTVKELFSL